MKKFYEMPELKIVMFQADIITGSGDAFYGQEWDVFN